MADWQIASGYRFGAVACGVRGDNRNRLDLTVIVSERPASAAGVFTQNRVVAAPVQLTRMRVPTSEALGLVVCAGNANACTGERGMQDAQRMAEVTAAWLDCRPEQILVCSTGVIGVPLPMSRIEHGIKTATSNLSDAPDALKRSAQAILTTDTRIKVHTRNVTVGGKTVSLTGLAKGAAMIGPNMATMLAFIFTDASVDSDELTSIARESAASTFNCITVEGHTSTNDTLLIFANGEGPRLTGGELNEFKRGIRIVCAELARHIAADAEGASHLIRVEVQGLKTPEDARRVAKTVAESALVKTAIFGADPNWGRFVSAAGYAGVDFAEDQLSCWLDDFLLYKAGVPQPFDNAELSNHMKESRELAIKFHFSIGTAGCTFWTSDLTYDYVRLNAEYTT
ncbi:MAG: bifunctional glutamate N-acetyltransferase/amino-acid acetyltransferase ArgJ [Gemmataceae bacterium]